jgi:hypothetical protein
MPPVSKQEGVTGIISWTLLNCRIKGRVNWLLWCITLLFIGKYIFL